MKFTALALVLFSFSAMASDLANLIKEEKCNIEVTKDIIIPYQHNGIVVGAVSIVTHRVDDNNNRRLKTGRILKIKKTTERTIELDEAAVKSVCFLNGHGGCASLYDVDADNFQGYSNNSLKLKCNAKPTIDI